MTATKEELKILVKQLVHEELKKELPHTCFTCIYFHFPIIEGVEQENKGNRNCHYNGSLRVESGVCQMWELQPDPRKRKPSFISYYPKE